MHLVGADCPLYWEESKNCRIPRLEVRLSLRNGDGSTKRACLTLQ